jgi:hypothetical protein
VDRQLSGSLLMTTKERPSERAHNVRLNTPIGDSGDFLEDATLEECACPCSNEHLEITLGVSLHDGSEDVNWLYLGCRCPECHLTATYGDWKNDFIGFRELLSRV